MSRSVFAVGILVLAFVLAGDHEGSAKAAPPPEPSRDRVINKGSGGRELDIKKFLVRGKTNIFEFYSDYCGACRSFNPLMKELVKRRPDLVRNRVDINRPGVEGIDFDSPLVRQYRVEFTPYFKLYDKGGKLVAEGRAAAHRVTQLLDAAGVLKQTE